MEADFKVGQDSYRDVEPVMMMMMMKFRLMYEREILYVHSNRRIRGNS
jgi:hypothetical protein